MSQKIVPIKTIPFAGGVDLAHEAAALPNGALSQDQNFRPRRPGKESRLGQAKHHTTTAHSTKDIISLYGFSKSEITERHLFAQYSDGSVDEATDNPPAVTTGNFGSSVLSSRSNPWPASWAKFRDMLIYTDGARIGQIYTGENMKPVFFNVHKGTSAIPDIPEEGADYTQEVIDDLSTTVAVLDSLSTLANYDALFVGFDTPVNKLTFTIPAVNGNASVATVSYRKNDSTWASASASDGTADSGKSLGQTGSFAWTLPTDEIPHYAFGRSCFIYRIVFSAALDAEVEVSAITGENTSGFQDIQNVWDGISPEAIEAVIADTSASTFANYSSQAILAGDIAATTDYLYINSIDRLFGLYLGVGGTPNITAATTIDEVATWTGEAFTALSTLNDGTNGGASSGYVTWQRNDDIRKVNFNSSQYHSYWYRIRFDKTLSSSLVWAIQTLPYFDINEIYPIQQAVCAWDNRLWYSFNDNMLYGTDLNKPMSLNGDNLVLVEAAKHSKNKAICMRRFYQFMLVWGEEKGEEGGYFTIVQPGTTASGYDSQVISERIGIMNNKCAVTLEDSNMGDLNTERPVMKGVYFLSRSGVYKSDGSFLKNISGAIGNYFDPSRAVCIRRGYEKEHFLSWDSTYGVIRLGLVSGNSAIVPNKHFIFDTTSDTWHEDLLGQPLSSISEVDGASGDIPVLQYGGGQDGNVYRLNTTNDDVSIAIDKSTKIELDGEGYQLRLIGMAFVLKDQAAGDIIVDIYVNGAAASEYTQTLTMISSIGDYKGHRFNCDVMGDHLTIRLRNNTSAQPVYLLEYGFDIEKIENNVAYD